MRHIVVLVGEYLPFISPNGNIANNLIEELKKTYKITVITRKNDINLERESIFDGVKIIRIPDYNLIIHKLCNEKIMKSTRLLDKTFYKIVLYIKRGFFFLPRLFSGQSISKYYVRKILRVLIKLNLNEKIDVLIPVSAPHEEVMAGVKFKKNYNGEINLLIYQLDRFSNANSLYPTKMFINTKINNNISLESQALKTCDKLFILPPLRQHYSNPNYRYLQEKITVTEHPLVKNISEHGGRGVIENKSISILYAGSLDTKLRSPKYLFELFRTESIRDSNLILNLYTFGNCQPIIDKYKILIKDKIFDYGRVSFNEVQNKMINCDFLLTIGNNSDNEVPSKLFEYLSFCKPIIHLYYSDNDVYLEYLKTYEHSICLKMDDQIIKENSIKLKEFCVEHENASIDFEKVAKLFETCTPKFVSQQFIKEIEK